MIYCNTFFNINQVIAGSANGRPRDSESRNLGSNPSPGTMCDFNTGILTPDVTHRVFASLNIDTKLFICYRIAVLYNMVCWIGIPSAIGRQSDGLQ